MKFALQAAMLVLLGPTFTGCHSVSASLMVPKEVSITRTIGGSARVIASGSSRQALLGPSVIGEESLQAAITEALLACGMFDEVTESPPSQHLLVVTVEEFVEPELGFDSTCEVTMRWTLKGRDGASTYWTRSIKTGATITSYEEMDSTVRPQLVIEKAVRNNLTEGIKALSAWAPQTP